MLDPSGGCQATKTGNGNMARQSSGLFAEQVCRVLTPWREMPWDFAASSGCWTTVQRKILL